MRDKRAHLPEDPHLLYATAVTSTDAASTCDLPDGGSAIARIQEAGKGRDLVGIYAAGGIHSGFANSLGQRNWHSNHNYNLDWSFYHQADKAVKTSYAGFSWDQEAFTRKVDWAVEVAQLLDTRYADCEKVTIVLDNLNTHTKGAFYEAFEPSVARAYVKRIEFVFTPKHGSWLNVAECELSCMTSQCLTGRRIGELDELQTEIAAWAKRTNEKQRGVDWQFKIDDARTKLKRLYPKIKSG